MCSIHNVEHFNPQVHQRRILKMKNNKDMAKKPCPLIILVNYVQLELLEVLLLRLSLSKISEELTDHNA